VEEKECGSHVHQGSGVSRLQAGTDGVRAESAPERLLIVMSNARKASMVRLRFQQSRDDLKDRLLVMAGMAKRAVQTAILGLPHLLALGEQAIDHLEREVDQMALALLATEHLLASDLRSTLAVIKLNGEPRTGAGTDVRRKVQPAGDR